MSKRYDYLREYLKKHPNGVPIKKIIEDHPDKGITSLNAALKTLYLWDEIEKCRECRTAKYYYILK